MLPSKSVQDAASEKEAKKKKIIKWVAIGVGVILLFLILRKLFGSMFDWGDDAVENQDAINAAIDGLDNVDITTELADDDSEPFYTYTSETALTEEVASSIYDTYQAKVDAMAEKINVPLDEMLAVVASTLLNNMSANSVVTEKAMELYLDHLNIWLPIYMAGNDQVFNKSAELAAKLLDANVASTTCTETVFMRDVTETLDQTNSQTTTTVATNGRSGGFLGMNKKKTSTSTTTIENVSTSNSTRHVQYIPHCAGWGISESSFLANMSSYTLGLSSIYAFFQTILDACPDVRLYVAASNTNAARKSA
jgi:hypothetical protein